ncbi:hypothetical protein SO802_017662 [Lithocarpus litseifolius]|uniref:Reverse transcriptase domain-containing protein n=1 Tax=Lithocarpus litseifolius TaxID=425828 RepID=A0AAW2CMZ6_9ROSI
MKEPWKFHLLSMPMMEIYAYLLEKKLVTPIFARQRDGAPLPGFDPCKKCENHFRAEGHSLEECIPLKIHIQDLIDNKLLQFEDLPRPDVVTNPLPPHL